MDTIFDACLVCIGDMSMAVHQRLILVGDVGDLVDVVITHKKNIFSETMHESIVARDLHSGFSGPHSAPCSFHL